MHMHVHVHMPMPMPMPMHMPTYTYGSSADAVRMLIAANAELEAEDIAPHAPAYGGCSIHAAALPQQWRCNRGAQWAGAN